jgi:hypothetical protein
MEIGFQQPKKVILKRYAIKRNKTVSLCYVMVHIKCWRNYRAAIAHIMAQHTNEYFRVKNIKKTPIVLQVAVGTNYFEIAN